MVTRVGLFTRSGRKWGSARGVGFGLGRKVKGSSSINYFGLEQVKLQSKQLWALETK